jgi:hypothetical protein
MARGERKRRQDMSTARIQHVVRGQQSVCMSFNSGRARARYTVLTRQASKQASKQTRGASQ